MMAPIMAPIEKRLHQAGILQIAENPYFGDQAKFTRFLIERYHVDKIWIDEGVLIGAEQINIATGLPIESNRDIKSVMEKTKKFPDEDIRQELRGGKRMTINSRGITIQRILDETRRWVARIFSTWFCNIGRPSDLPKS